MEPDETVFNHVGLCVSDIARSRAFYEGALGFTFWWELERLPPEDELAKLLMLDTPLDLRATYLVRDGMVLELLQYHPDRMRPARARSMAEPGFTHLSVSVGDKATAFERIERFGGTVLHETDTAFGAMVRDPDGQLVELLGPGWRRLLPPRPG